MANLEDYLPGGKLDPVGGIASEIADAGQQQAARQDDATPPNVDWEARYKDLQVHNSRQAQTLGQQRQMIDDFIVNPTPREPVVAEEAVAITTEELYDNPASAIDKTVDAHPAIQEARELTAAMKKRDLDDSVKRFEVRHPDYQTISTEPEFIAWVEEDATRVDLYQRGNGYDLSAADALFSYYKADKGIAKITNEQEQAQAIAAASLESSAGAIIPEGPAYTRTEYQLNYQRANQGDAEAAAWVKANVSGYRAALAAGEVRD